MRNDWIIIVILAALLALFSSPVWYSEQLIKLLPNDQNTIKHVIMAAIGSAAGAFGGAWIVERNQNRKSLLEELRNTNAAIMASFHVFSSALNRKKSEILPILKNFEEQQALLKKGLQGNPGVFSPDLDSLEVFPINLSTLEEILFRRLNLNAKALASYSELAKFSSLLDAAVVRRNGIIDRWKGEPFDKIVNEFFGLNVHKKDNDFSTKTGDHTFPKTLDTMRLYVDDCMFYSMHLCKELMIHGKSLHERLNKSDDIKAIKIKFEDIDAKLIPKRSEHERWLAQFV